MSLISSKNKYSSCILKLNSTPAHYIIDRVTAGSLAGRQWRGVLPGCCADTLRVLILRVVMRYKKRTCMLSWPHNVAIFVCLVYLTRKSLCIVQSFFRHLYDISTQTRQIFRDHNLTLISNFTATVTSIIIPQCHG